MKPKPQFNPHMERLLAYASAPRADNARHAFDGGCGDGRIAIRLSSHGWNVTAMDLEHHADWCQFPCSPRFETGNLYEYQPPEPFDLICLFGVLHYCGSDRKVEILMDKVGHMAKPDSLFLLNWISDEIPYPTPGVHLPSRDTVGRLAHEQGFLSLEEWGVEVRHDHGQQGPHRHFIAYSAWRRNGADMIRGS